MRGDRAIAAAHSILEALALLITGTARTHNRLLRVSHRNNLRKGWRGGKILGFQEEERVL